MKLMRVRVLRSLSRRLVVAISIVGLSVALSGCTTGPVTGPISLEPEASAPVWPPPPGLPRYALAKILIGEQNFILPDQEEASKMESAFNWIVGLIVGETEYIELQRPVSGLTDERGWVYVVDASHKAIVVFDMTDHVLRLWKTASKGVGFTAPVGIAQDGSGGFLVTDAELGEVFRLGPEGRPIGRFGQGILSRPTGIARDESNGLIYVADTASHDIKVFDADGLLVDTLGGRGKGPGLFNAPTHLFFVGGELYVSDTLNFRVQVFNRAGDERLAFGRVGLFVGNMTRPKGVAVGGQGRIYVVESYYDHLLVFDPEGRLLLPIGGTGPGIGEFFLPSGVWADKFGRVYVADMFNGRVVILKELTSVKDA